MQVGLLDGDKEGVVLPGEVAPVVHLAPVGAGEEPGLARVPPHQGVGYWPWPTGR